MCIVIFLCFKAHTPLEIFLVPVFVVVIMTAEKAGNILPAKVFDWLNEVSMPMYIFQVACISIGEVLFGKTAGMIVITLLLDFCISIIWLVLKKKLTK